LVEVDDAPALMNIYNPEVVETTVTFDLVPRTLEEQEDWIRNHLKTHPCFVAVNDEDTLGEIGARGEKILGFALVSPFRDRPAYATTVENSVYVLREARGRGVGENEGSIRLHEKCGFTLVGTEIEVGRKHGRWLDVVEYQYVVRARET
jgi:phosphinothricin acetyltransferase